MKSRVLITGVEGFTGMHLADTLTSKGYEVLGTSFLDTDQPNLVPLDVKDIGAVSKVIRYFKPNYVVHLAGISHVVNDASTFYHTNTIGTENLLLSLSEASFEIRKVILAGSALVYGNKGGEISEQSALNPVNHYGLSKLAMEKVAMNFFSKLPIVVARPFNYTGPGQSLRFVIPKIVKHFRERAATIELGNTHVKREYNSVADVTRIYARLLEMDHHSLFVNIGSGKTFTLDEIINFLTEITGHKIKLEVNPAFVRANEVHELKSDPTFLQSLVGLDPFTTSINYTLSWMLKS